MRKSRQYKRPKVEQQIFYRRNEQITAPKLRLIDENGSMIGVVFTIDALHRAKAAEVDLIEVSPKAEPPVAKILDYGKFIYQQEKMLQKQKTRAKQTEIKGVRLSLRIGEHDLETRRVQAEKFLKDGDKVRVEMILRGRERQHTGSAKEQMESFCQSLAEISQVEQPFNKQEGKLSMIITPK